MGGNTFEHPINLAKLALPMGAIIAVLCSEAIADRGTNMQTSVRIKADEALEYAGFCKTEQSAEKIDIRGKGDRTLKIEGAGVLCELQIIDGDKPLVLEIVSHSGNRSKTSTKGIGSKVRLKVG